MNCQICHKKLSKFNKSGACHIHAAQKVRMDDERKQDAYIKQQRGHYYRRVAARQTGASGVDKG